MHVRVQAGMYACVRGVELAWLNGIGRAPLHPTQLQCCLVDVVHAIAHVRMYGLAIGTAVGTILAELSQALAATTQTIAM